MPTPVVPNLTSRINKTFWTKGEIYVGPDGLPSQQYVPNIDDAVFDWNGGLFRVTAIDDSTHIATLIPYNLTQLRNGVRATDILIGSGPGAASNAYRIYIDTRETPHRVDFDSKLYLRGNDVTYVKIFRGTDISADTGQVISAMINGSNQVTSENVPVELVGFNTIDNIAIKRPVPCYVTETLADSEPVTVVTYTNSGRVTSVSTLLVSRTNFMRTVDGNAKYVTSIRLITPYLSTTDSTILEVPLNMTLSSVSLRAQVNYSNGLSATYTVDGNKFELMGADNYITSQLGRTSPAILKYNLSADEFTVDAGGEVPNVRVKLKDYKIMTVKSDSIYSAKVYALPRWNSSTLKYDLKFYLYNLDRSAVYDVTPYIEYSVQSTPFDGGNYNAVQVVSFAVNLENLGSSFQYYRHPQSIKIDLRAPATDANANTYYIIDYNDDVPLGAGLHALVKNDQVNIGAKSINLANGISTVTEFIEKVFKPTYPLILRPAETSAPTPTHVLVKIGTWSKLVDINNILEDINNITVSVGQGTPVELQFSRTSTPNNIELSALTLVCKGII